MGPKEYSDGNESFEKILSKIEVGISESTNWPSDDDPVLIKKLEDAIQALKKNPIPEWVLNRTPKPE